MRAWPALSAKNAPVAQLDRASDYESEGRTFESFRARHSVILRDIVAERLVKGASNRRQPVLAMQLPVPTPAAIRLAASLVARIIVRSWLMPAPEPVDRGSGRPDRHQAGNPPLPRICGHASHRCGSQSAGRPHSVPQRSAAGHRAARGRRSALERSGQAGINPYCAFWSRRSPKGPSTGSCTKIPSLGRRAVSNTESSVPHPPTQRLEMSFASRRARAFA